MRIQHENATCICHTRERCLRGGHAHRAGSNHVEREGGWGGGGKGCEAGREHEAHSVAKCTRPFCEMHSTSIRRYVGRLALLEVNYIGVRGGVAVACGGRVGMTEEEKDLSEAGEGAGGRRVVVGRWVVDASMWD